MKLQPQQRPTKPIHQKIRKSIRLHKYLRAKKVV